MDVYNWNWHDFESKCHVSEQDTFEQYNFYTEDVNTVTVLRQFWVGSAKQGHLFSIVFERINNLNVIRAIMGEDKYKEHRLILPKSGAWCVQFDLAENSNNFRHVALSSRCKRELFESIACAVYDHYNVSKSGLYCWYAARMELVGLYDRALGFTSAPASKQKFIPGIQKLKSQANRGKGYAILTSYYEGNNC